MYRNYDRLYLLVLKFKKTEKTVVVSLRITKIPKLTKGAAKMCNSTLVLSLVVHGPSIVIIHFLDIINVLYYK